MSTTLRSTAAISLAATLGLTFSAVAQQQPHEPTKRLPVQGQNHPPGPPEQHLPGPAGHPSRHVVHALGERGYSFRGPGDVRREIATFNPREREIWLGGRWHHDVRFGRLGYWWEINGAWYFYDRPFEGPPAFVSEVEFMDEGLGPGAPAAVVGAPAPAVVAPVPAVVVAPPTGRRRASATAGRVRRPALRSVTVAFISARHYPGLDRGSFSAYEWIAGSSRQLIGGAACPPRCVDGGPQRSRIVRLAEKDETPIDLDQGRRRTRSLLKRVRYLRSHGRRYVQITIPYTLHLRHMLDDPRLHHRCAKAKRTNAESRV
jgi:hypothetical protein